MKFKRVLVLSPHPDDAELGCGGFIDKLNDGHTEFMWMVFSDCDESLEVGFKPGTVVVEHEKVMQMMGLKSVVFNMPVRNFPQYRQEILELIIGAKESFNPDLVLCPCLSDLHQDHRVVAEEALRAFKSSASIFGYELPADHLEFKPVVFITLQEKNLDRKIEMFCKYESQIVKERAWNNSAYIKSLATVRGASVGERYAEAFEVYRMRG